MQDLLAELGGQTPAFEQGEALTTIEMAEALGVSTNTMRRRLRPLKATGQIRVARKRVEALNGTQVTVTAWIVAPQADSLDTSTEGGET
jgi:DNA-binding transcriptional regulator YhcF (GntR family)